jgi:hypothetical protein
MSKRKLRSARNQESWEHGYGAVQVATRLGQRNHRSERLRLRSELLNLGKALSPDDRSMFKTSAELRLKNLALRHQLVVVCRSASKQLKLTAGSSHLLGMIASYLV